jgi:hypothetical protein
VYGVQPLSETLTDHVFDFGALKPTSEAHFIRAKLASACSPFARSPELVDELRKALLSYPEVKEAEVTMHGSRLLAFVSPKDTDDESGFTDFLKSFGDFTPAAPGEYAKMFRYSRYGFVIPADTHLRAGKADKVACLLSPTKLGEDGMHKVPSVIVGLKALRRAVATGQVDLRKILSSEGGVALDLGKTAKAAMARPVLRRQRSDLVQVR